MILHVYIIYLNRVVFKVFFSEGKFDLKNEEVFGEKIKRSVFRIIWRQHIILSTSSSWRGLLDTTLYDKVWHRLATGRWFSSGTRVSHTSKSDRHDIAEQLLSGTRHNNSLSLSRCWCCWSFLERSHIIHRKIDKSLTFFKEYFSYGKFL